MKSDLKEKREVSKKDAKDFAASVGIPWKECSSKLNLNVTESVLGMVAAIGNRLGLAFATDDAVFDVSKAADISDDDADSFRYLTNFILVSCLKRGRVTNSLNRKA